METISVSELKTHLSAELKRIERGIELTVVDHKRPIAKLSPVNRDVFFVREATCRYEYISLDPLVSTDPLQFLEEERGEF
jgi:antitoxin (DNA-binding transcriptional repressor) of toxin-antitoxin stability system